MNPSPPSTKKLFSGYQWLLILMLTAIQFTHFLDFIIISPLGKKFYDQLRIGPEAFGFVVSAYAFSAGIFSLLSSFIADVFDRKKYLVFFYIGFIVGTFFCGLVIQDGLFEVSQQFTLLIIARIVTGAFGGVLASIVFTIISDTFELAVRGRTMGILTIAFSVVQVIGLPIGLIIAETLNISAVFYFITLISVPILVLSMIKIKPITGHLDRHEKNPVFRTILTAVNPSYMIAFGTTAFLASTGFLLMPVIAPFLIFNVGVNESYGLPVIYLVAGIATVLLSPVAGSLADRFGKYAVFFVSSIIVIGLIQFYTNLGPSSLFLVLLINALLMVMISGRMVSAMALLTAVPENHVRGRFMSLNSAVQQVAAGVAAAITGLIAVQFFNPHLISNALLNGLIVPDGTVFQKLAQGFLLGIDGAFKDIRNVSPILGFNILGLIAGGVVLLSTVMMYFVNHYVYNVKPLKEKPAMFQAAPKPEKSAYEELGTPSTVDFVPEPE